MTFRIRAPQATTVTLTGDWLATLASSTGGPTPMTKDASGVWSVTTAPLEPTVHLYFFTVDGMNIADPINPKLKLRVRTSASLVEVPDTPPAVWQVRDVPHGSVDWNWHQSTAYNDTHEFLVYLPPGYFTSKARYPVLYLVHGAGDTALGWTTAGAANLILDSLIAEKKAVPMIVVMPFNGSECAAPARRRSRRAAAVQVRATGALAVRGLHGQGAHPVRGRRSIASRRVVRIAPWRDSRRAAPRRTTWA